MYKSTYVCMHAYMDSYAHACMYVWLYAWIHTCMFTYNIQRITEFCDIKIYIINDTDSWNGNNFFFCPESTRFCTLVWRFHGHHRVLFLWIRMFLLIYNKVKFIKCIQQSMVEDNWHEIIGDSNFAPLNISKITGFREKFS